ncbi:MAG: sugar phosphate isomerase/epimerase [Planctomycetes bacterium]|nr:sugar phosphate isomerase/epimerase [Planctomycetota bacterium]
MFGLSINELTTFHARFDEDVENYSAAGVGALGVVRAKIEAYGIEKGIQLLRSRNLKASGVVWGGGFIEATPEATRSKIEEAVRGVELAGRLDADSFLLVSGARGETPLSQARMTLAEACREVASAGSTCGVKVGLEPIHHMYASEWTFVFSLDDGLRVLDAARHDNLGLIFDTYHLWQEKDLLKRIPQVAGRIVGVHISDWRQPPRNDNDRLVPGDGVIPLRDILQALHESGYRGWYEVEIFSDELWKSDYRQLVQRCIAGWEKVKPRAT